MTQTITKDTENTACCQATSETNCSEPRTSYTPRFDVRETNNEIVLFGDLPGVSTEDLDICFEKGELSIQGRVARKQGGDRRIRMEYGIGDFHRKFSVSESIDADAITASLKDGVLTLHLPKTEAVKPRRIMVQS